MRIALVSCIDLPEPDVDESALLNALYQSGKELGVAVDAAVVAWNDGSVVWSEWDCAVVRSTWDYPWQVEAFRSWIAAVSAQTLLINDAAAMEWNLDKRYMRLLERQGIAIVPTVWVLSPDEVELPEDDEWSRIVVKPCISAGSWRTEVIDRRGDTRWREQLASALAQLSGEAGMIQPYQVSVEDYGERSLIYIGGEYSHSIRKSPRFAGDDEHVSSQSIMAREDERALADRVLQAIPNERPEACGQPVEGKGSSVASRLVYARVDIIRGPSDEPRLAELELVEPSLFLIQHPSSASALACAIIRNTSQAARILKR